MRLHVFIAMPFGVKTDGDGNLIDFEKVYAALVKPALEDAGLEAWRADAAQAAGDIQPDHFQELLIADLVVVDLTLDDPDVWYQLGVRHALRPGGVILLQGPRSTQPFARYTDDKMRYRLRDGAPDPDTLAAERQALGEMAHHALPARPAPPTSPIYALLPGLKEPAWQRLRVDTARTFWQQHEAWTARIAAAANAERPEDILVLADEAPITALRVEARLRAGEVLCRLQHFDFALEQFELALAFNPSNEAAARQRSICLQGIGRLDEAHAVDQPVLRPKQHWQADKVFLFSGHMIDGPERPEPRFPADKEAIAAARIAEALDHLGAGPNDLALAQGASGGDLLFGEACLARGVRFQMLLPLAEPEFIAASVLPAVNGENWRKRYFALRERLSLPIRLMPDALGPLPQDRAGQAMNPFERCNRWLLYSALAQGISRVRCICLWDGGGGDGPGGTAHLVSEVKRRNGQVTWLDTRQLW